MSMGQQLPPPPAKLVTRAAGLFTLAFVMLAIMMPQTSSAQSYTQTHFIPLAREEPDRTVLTVIGPGPATFTINNYLSVTGSSAQLLWGLFVKKIVSPPEESPVTKTINVPSGVQRVEYWSKVEVQRGTETWEEEESGETYSRVLDSTKVLELDITVLP